MYFLVHRFQPFDVLEGIFPFRCVADIGYMVYFLVHVFHQDSISDALIVVDKGLKIFRGLFAYLVYIIPYNDVV